MIIIIIDPRFQEFRETTEESHESFSEKQFYEFILLLGKKEEVIFQSISGIRNRTLQGWEDGIKL